MIITAEQAREYASPLYNEMKKIEKDIMKECEKKLTIVYVVVTDDSLRTKIKKELEKLEYIVDSIEPIEPFFYNLKISW